MSNSNIIMENMKEHLCEFEQGEAKPIKRLRFVKFKGLGLGIEFECGKWCYYQAEVSATILFFEVTLGLGKRI